MSKNIAKPSCLELEVDLCRVYTLLYAQASFHVCDAKDKALNQTCVSDCSQKVEFSDKEEENFINCWDLDAFWGLF